MVTSDAVGSFLFAAKLAFGVDAWSHFGRTSNFKIKTIFRAKQHVNVWLCAIIFSETSKKNDGLLSNMNRLLGITCIVSASLFINGESKFPGWLALLPTLGAVFIISGGTLAWVNRAILSSRVFVWFGLISFPLYCGIGFAVILRLMEGDTPSVGQKLIAVGTAIMLSALRLSSLRSQSEQQT